MSCGESHFKNRDKIVYFTAYFVVGYNKMDGLFSLSKKIAMK